MACDDSPTMCGCHDLLKGQYRNFVMTDAEMNCQAVWCEREGEAVIQIDASD